jgi:hypothetical protein
VSLIATGIQQPSRSIKSLPEFFSEQETDIEFGCTHFYRSWVPIDFMWLEKTPSTGETDGVASSDQ